MALFFVLVALGMSQAIESVPIEEEEELSEQDENALGYENFLFSQPHSLLKDLDHDESEFVPAPDTLNLAYFYSEGEDTSDAIHSFAGEEFSCLNTMSADLYASFYDLLDTSPLSMALSMGLSKNRVMGGFNPEDEAHDPSKPDTWTVNSFSNVSVSFYNAQGERIDGYYPAKEIMSLANVYMYFQADFDPEHFKDYCDLLFNEAISYKVSLGNVYYCSGCLNKSASQEASEALALEAEELALSSSISLEEAYSLLDITSREETIEEIIDTGAEAKTLPETVHVEQTLPETITYSLDETFIESIEEAAADTEVLEVILAESEAAEETLGEAEAAAETQSQETIEEIFDPNFISSPNVIYQETKDEAKEETSQNFVSYAQANDTTPKYYVDEEGIVNYDIIRSGYSGPLSEEDSEKLETVSETLQEETEAQIVQEIAIDESLEKIRTLLLQANIQEASETYCPGHIDIYVTVTISGIDDEAGLFSIDPIGNDPDNFTDSWQGWTDEMKEYARTLSGRDWFDEYGLSISSISLSSALSDEDIEDYLLSLPPDTSELRKDIVRYALQSVGKVPYYWGGKPKGPGYDKNSFGVLISPDTRGRILNGLDCSGWINWIYWSVTGSSLDGQSTGTLVGCGKKISRSELLPGDIIIRVGGDAHVVMFLCWAGDGDFYAVHETGGVINNVTVSKMTANWPYYRSLID